MLLEAICIATPLLSFGRTIYQYRDTIRWIHFPRWDARIMARKKKEAETWKCKDGREILVAEMEDVHLANSIKMVARQCIINADLIVKAFRTSPSKSIVNKSIITKNLNFKKLANEAEKRKFRITFLNEPILLNGKQEYVEILIPTPRSRIAASFFPTDWDSRPQE